MSSSTSSSRKIFLKIFLACTLGMIVSLAPARIFTWAQDARTQILDRVFQARDALPRITEETDDLIMVFGSSMTEAGFAARQFDRQLSERGIEVTSFNFGFGGLNPYFQDLWSRRIRDGFLANDRKLRLTVIEFCPFQVTKSRWNGAQSIRETYETMLSTPEELWEVTLNEPTRGIRMLNIHYLRDDISAELITWFLGQELHSGPPRSDLPEDEEAIKLLGELGEQLQANFKEEYPDYDDAAWSYSWQGAGTIPEERSPETLEIFPRYYKALQQPRRLENDRLQRINCCDIEELHFEPVLVEAFIRMVKNFQEFSDEVEVILLPKNSRWIHYTPEARARMAVVLERVQKETGVTIRNFQDLDLITPEMYSDTTHLARYQGDVPFTAHLVDVYESQLRRPPSKPSR